MKRDRGAAFSRPGERSVLVGCDVGGTFTDVVSLDPAAGAVRFAKLPTSRGASGPAEGVLAALRAAAPDLHAVQSIVHGTTVTTNAVLERKLCTVGLITTKGFRDVLELGRRTRPKQYGLGGSFVPLVSREHRLEVGERIDRDGKVLVELDEAGVEAAAKELLAKGCESLLIHFLHSYADDAHERRAAEVARRVWPNPYVTTGSAVMREFREFERGVAGAVNAAVQPILADYVAQLSDALQAGGYRRENKQELLVMQGNGGTVGAAHVAEKAVSTVMSGPASGVIAAAYTSGQSGQSNLLTYDMGGTSTDVGLVIDGVPEVSSDLELEYAMPIHVPMVNVRTIGAGGGSVAFVNKAGLLQVGPRSAGSFPGPICYRRGGAEPTITDANLLLGRLNVEELLAVDGAPDVGQVRDAFAALGEPLGIGAVEAAASVLALANANMADACRMMTLANGYDPRDFALFAFGGAGPLHAVAMARELGIPTVLVPARPGITNALGCLVADIRHDYASTVNKPLGDVCIEGLRAQLRHHKELGASQIEVEGVEVESLTHIHVAEMQFLGQSHMIQVPLDPAAASSLTKEALAGAFADAYRKRFGLELPGTPVQLVTVHTAVIGKRKPVDLSLLLERRGGGPSVTPKSERQTWFVGGGWVTTPVFDRQALPVGFRFAGPAILEQLDTTIVIEPGCTALVDAIGNLLVDVNAGVAADAVPRLLPGGDSSTDAASELSPLLLSVVESALQQVCAEMDLAFVRSAFSPVISEAEDRASGIYGGATGELVAQGRRGLPIFIGTMQYSVEAVIAHLKRKMGDRYPSAVQPGDIYMLNDPYLGGTHLMDVRMVMPYFHDGELVAWLANVGHWRDTGGAVPGGFSATATEIEQEGLRLPPVLLVRGGEVVDDVLSIVLSNIRVADQTIGDIKAQIAALQLGQRRFEAMLAKHGAATVQACIGRLRANSAAQMREQLRAVPDGTYTGEAFVDSDGIVNEPLKIALSVTAKDGTLTFDLGGSSPPCLGPLNCVLATTKSSIFVAMKHIFPDIPVNAGFMDHLTIKDPEGTFLYAKYPRPVSGCAAEVSQRVCEAVFVTLAPVLPGLLWGAPAGTAGNIAVGGTDPSTGRPYIMYIFTGGGYGGSKEGDGHSNGCATVGSNAMPPYEVLEMRFPVVFDEFKLTEGSGGAGESRGGMGVEYTFHMRGGLAKASMMMDHGLAGPPGVLGGEEGGKNMVVVSRSGGGTYVPSHLSKDQDVELRPGDTVTVRTPGGGGYGDALRRDPAAVAADVRKGYLTAKEALMRYRVALVPDADGTGLAVDAERTAKLRVAP